MRPCRHRTSVGYRSGRGGGYKGLVRPGGGSFGQGAPTPRQQPRSRLRCASRSGGVLPRLRRARAALACMCSQAEASRKHPQGILDPGLHPSSPKVVHESDPRCHTHQRPPPPPTTTTPHCSLPPPYATSHCKQQQRCTLDEQALRVGGGAMDVTRCVMQRSLHEGCMRMGFRAPRWFFKSGPRCRFAPASPSSPYSSTHPLLPLTSSQNL